ncbi:hypothetical protein C7974DRAFT_411989 [Boeremia exigua]|uniref:uncharacterized protein n=1 Tax=Boeremia exigua TaxID=749465 RepID=UPI001E8DEABD|nr:uncharacterized protein C7974DRAFT_411989 [Boeremia exigua]KAH6632960.1 hypothetical protein C7974DRAFT_411989 [Boeremia exigua]
MAPPPLPRVTLSPPAPVTSPSTPISPAAAATATTNAYLRPPPHPQQPRASPPPSTPGRRFSSAMNPFAASTVSLRTLSLRRLSLRPREHLQRPASAASQLPVAATASRSRRFFARVGRLGARRSVGTRTTETRHGSASPPAPAPADRRERSTEVVRQQRTAHTSLPELPPPVPLPPQQYLETFDKVLQSGIDALSASPSTTISSPCQTPTSPYHSSASASLQDAPTIALVHFSRLSDLAASIAHSWPEFWALLVHTATLLISVARDVGVRSVLLKGLVRIVAQWNEVKSSELGMVDVAQAVREVVDEVAAERRAVGEGVAAMFAWWVGRCGVREGDRLVFAATGSVDPGSAADVGGLEVQDSSRLRVLALELSPVVVSGLTLALASDPHLTITLSVVSSADNHRVLLLSPDLPPMLQDRLHIATHPSSAIGTVSQEVDILLLDARCIDSAGNVQSEKGALGTAVCANTLSPRARVVVLGAVDNIISVKRVEESAKDTASQLELVPAQFVDVYIAETRVLGVDELERLATVAGELEMHVLGKQD